MHDWKRRLSTHVRWFQCALAGACLAGTLVTSGCGRAGRVSRANEQLRARNADLESSHGELTKRIAELEAEVARRTSDDGGGPSDDVRLNTPHAVSISLGKLSHARDSDGDGASDAVVVYVEPVDGRGRFVQITGSVAAHVAVLPAEAPARTLGAENFAPGQVRDSYRSSFTGMHYTFEVPLREPAGALDTHATVRIVFTDGWTGKSLSAERSLALK